MKSTTRSALSALMVVLLLLVPLVGAAAAAGGKHVFILSGQSNMVGMDPDVAFTPAVTTAFGEEGVIVVKDAHGGQSIRSWCRSNHEFPPPTTGRVPKVRGELYGPLIGKVKAAIKEQLLETITLVWMQGESDLNNTAYDAYLMELLAQLQEDLDFQEVNMVIGRISDSGLDREKRLAGRLRIRRIQQEFAEAHPRGAWVDTDDLNDRQVDGELIHDLHYTEAGYRTLGVRFAERAITLIEGEAKTEVPRLPLVPYPQEVVVSNGHFTPGVQLLLSQDQGLDELAEACAEDLSGLGFTVSHGENAPGTDAEIIALSLVKDPALGPEGYGLEIGDGISIRASTRTGLFWGTRTLLQLLHAGPGGAIPHLNINDHPKFAYRGLMIDNARSFHSIDFHIATIKRMHGFIKSRERQMLVWEGFSPTLEPAIHKDIIVCPFDVKHQGKMPADYFNAGYTVLNTSWTPLYVADKLYMTTPEIIARWSPYMFGAGRSPQPFAYWRKFKPDHYRGRVLGGQVCSWATEEKAEEGLLFGTGPGFPEYGRPGKRVPVMAERVWTGSGTTAKDLLERVGGSYWE